MKKLRRWAALALCCALLFTLAACGGDGGSSQSLSGADGMGRYVETDITPPGAEEEYLSSFLTKDGTLLCYTRDLKKRFESTDGGATWQESEGPGAKIDGNVDNFTLLADGSLLAALSDDAGMLTGLVKIAPDGTTEPFSVPALDEAIATGKTTYISQLKALSADRLFLGFSSGDFGGIATETDEDTPNENGGEDEAPEGGDESQSAAPEDASVPEDEGSGGVFVGGEQTNFAGLIDLATGAPIAEYPDWYGVSVTADETTLYLLDYNGEVLAKSLADGTAKAEGESKLPVSDFSFNLALGRGRDCLYLLDGKRLLKMAPGAEAETLLDGSTYSFSDPTNSPAAVHELENGDIVLNLMGMNNSRLYKYSWDENASLDPSQILKVWSLYENYLVRAAISELRKQNPDIAIEYEVALGESDGVTVEDAVKNLNTRLLNGDGPDVMILDGCPAENYAACGMLADLSSLVDTSGMFQNIADPFVTDTGTFYLPTNVKIPLLLGTKESLAGAGSLEELAQSVQQGNGLPPLGNDDDVFSALAEDERPVLAPEGLEELFNILWNSSSGSIIKEGKLDNAALEGMLSALLAISDKYKLGEDGGAASGAVAMMSTGGAVATVSGSALSYSSQRALLGAYLADDMQMLQYMMEPPGSEMASFPGLSGGSFVPVNMVGISADSQKADMAAQFVNTLLSETVQGTRTGAGFPVTEAGFKKQIADIDEMMREYQDESFTFDYAPLMALAQTPQMADDVVKEMVWATAQSLCEGNLTLEGAVKELEQNLKNYLAERQ